MRIPIGLLSNVGDGRTNAKILGFTIQQQDCKGGRGNCDRFHPPSDIMVYTECCYKHGTRFYWIDSNEKADVYKFV